MDTKPKHSWQESIRAFCRRSVITMLFFGFSAGIPILLIFSSLSLWLREAGVERSEVTFFSWAALGYSFKFVWAPIVDRLPLPGLTSLLGRRRSWILFSQIMIMVAILGMALTNPAASVSSLTVMACFAVLLGFSSATQDIVIDAYRIEADDQEVQALLSSTYIAGYRIAMVVAGAGALYLAQYFGSSKDNYSYGAWMWTYVVMASVMLIGVVTTFLAKEPESNSIRSEEFTTQDYGRFFFLFLVVSSCFATSFFLFGGVSSAIADGMAGVLGKSLGGLLGQLIRLAFAISVAASVSKILLIMKVVNRPMVQETYIDPVKDFFNRYGRSVALLLLALVGLYRISDIVLGVMSNVFYQDMGYTKMDIANAVKTFGLFMTIFGGFVGGVLTVRFGVMRMLFVGAALAAATNLLFMFLASSEPTNVLLYTVVAADNLVAGMASATFVAFLSSLTNVSFTAMQYAIFSSLMTLIPKVVGGYTGSIVDSVGYPVFFLITAIMGLPVLYIIWLADKKLDVKEPAQGS